MDAPFKQNLSRALFDRCQQWSLDLKPEEATAIDVQDFDILGMAVVRAILDNASETDAVIREAVATAMADLGLPHSLSLADEAIATVKAEMRRTTAR